MVRSDNGARRRQKKLKDKSQNTKLGQHTIQRAAVLDFDF